MSSSSSSSVNKGVEIIAASIVNSSRGTVNHEHHWSFGKPVGDAIVASTMIVSSTFIVSTCLAKLNTQMLARKDTNREFRSTLQVLTASVATLTLTLNAGLFLYYYQCSRK